MRRFFAAVCAAVLLALGVAAPAQAFACGDSAAQWAPTLGTSTWTGTLGSETLVLELTTVQGVAAAVVGIIPLVGTWTVQGDQLLVAVATGAIEYLINVSPTCSGGVVVSAAGGATDAFFQVHSVSMTRVL